MRVKYLPVRQSAQAILPTSRRLDTSATYTIVRIAQVVQLALRNVVRGQREAGERHSHVAERQIEVREGQVGNG